MSAPPLSFETTQSSSMDDRTSPIAVEARAPFCRRCAGRLVAADRPTVHRTSAAARGLVVAGGDCRAGDSRREQLGLSSIADGVSRPQRDPRTQQPLNQHTDRQRQEVRNARAAGGSPRHRPGRCAYRDDDGRGPRRRVNRRGTAGDRDARGPTRPPCTKDGPPPVGPTAKHDPAWHQRAERAPSSSVTISTAWSRPSQPASLFRSFHSAHISSPGGSAPLISGIVGSPQQGTGCLSDFSKGSARPARHHADNTDRSRCGGL
jgi:hypothetical protein